MCIRDRYGIVYMHILKAFSSAKAIANADIRSIRKCVEFKGQGKRISLSAEQLKLCLLYTSPFTTNPERFDTTIGCRQP